ncbi:helix-turn-helix domain-containing protein [Maridesulfovibrio sp.]|uniref:helix-turn-helix domain-containing protein n=1 Tax=Maridesulfovibrio sp. TaxID=2795000 RepID=UPI0029C9E51F|nr:helix-turn-helix domain-containing protein [Maridesulfovibrio sp.]
MTIGERIKRVRGEISQTKFAESLGIVQRTLANYEIEKSLPNSVFLANLAQKYSVSSEWLLFGEGPMKREEGPEQARGATQEETQTAASGSNELEYLRQDNRDLRQDNRELRLENKDLRQENRDLRDENRQLRESQKQNHFAPKTEQNDSASYSTGKDQYDLNGASPP